MKKMMMLAAVAFAAVMISCGSSDEKKAEDAKKDAQEAVGKAMDLAGELE